MIDTNIVIESLLILILAFILREYFNIFFDYKSELSRFHLFSWLLYGMIRLIIDNTITLPNFYLNIVMNGFLFLFICIFAYFGKLYKKIIYTILFLTIWTLVEMMLAYVFMYLEIDYTKYILLGSIISKFILFTIVRAIALFSKTRVNTEIPMKYWVVLLLIPVCSIVVIIGIFTFANEIYSINIAVIAFSIGIVMLFINFIIFIVYDKLTEDMVIHRQNILYKQQLNLCGKQAAEREEAMLDVRKIRHDMKNHLIYLREMVDLEDKENLINYLNNLIKDGDIEKTGISKSANIVIDALINYKYTIAKKQDIDFQINIAVPYKIPYEDGDICIILGNALDNAIEATSEVEADKRYIKLTIGSRKNTIVIHVKNSFSGLTQKDKYSKYMTTKKDSINHGLGLASIQKAVDRYNGEMSIEENVNEFSLTVMLYAIEE